MLFVFIACSKNNEEEQFLANLENTLPGTWEVVRLNNVHSDSSNFENATLMVGSFLENFGTITFPEFDLEIDENGSVNVISIPCEFQLGDFVFPLSFTNQAFITFADDDAILQGELLPKRSIDVIGENIEAEEVIDEFLIHQFYGIEINSSTSIDLSSRNNLSQIILNLVKR